MLVRAEDLGALVEIRQSLIDSVLGGAREFTNGELGPLYRHILDRAEALATRHRDDPHQGALYKAIASGERQVVEGHRQQHRMEVEALE
jgi:hypothetical protein